jgi:hypothetical protein
MLGGSGIDWPSRQTRMVLDRILQNLPHKEGKIRNCPIRKKNPKLEI